jgi:small-conductance mechanosensitive channel
MNPLLVAFIILVTGAFLGFLFDRIILARLKAITKKTKWTGDEVIIHAMRGMVIIWFTLASGYYALRHVPLTDFWADHTRKGLLIITILTFTVFISKLIAGFVALNTSKISQRVPVTSIFTTVTHFFIYTIGLLIILESLGISVTPILTALGVGGIAVALALQDTLTNLFAGFHILASKTIRPGDYVKLQSGEEGYIVDIEWRVTSIKAGDHFVIIPNSKIATAIVLNYYLPEEKITLKVSASVVYTSDLKKVEDLTLQTAKEIMKETEGCCQEDEPQLRFTGFEDNGVRFNILIKVNEYDLQFKIKSEFIKRLHQRYKENGIEISYPAKNVFVKNS